MRSAPWHIHTHVGSRDFTKSCMRPTHHARSNALCKAHSLLPWKRVLFVQSKEKKKERREKWTELLLRPYCTTGILQQYRETDKHRQTQLIKIKPLPQNQHLTSLNVAPSWTLNIIRDLLVWFGQRAAQFFKFHQETLSTQTFLIPILARWHASPLQSPGLHQCRVYLQSTTSHATLSGKLLI